MKKWEKRDVFTMDEMRIMGMTPDPRYNRWNIRTSVGWWEVDGVRYKDVVQYRLRKIKDILNEKDE